MGNGSDVNDIVDVLLHQLLFSLKNQPKTHIYKFKTLIKLPQSKQIRIFCYMRTDSVISFNFSHASWSMVATVSADIIQ